MEMRNLYEVNEDIIKPACSTHLISYVELLSKRNPSRDTEQITFVSHWWGQEFVLLVEALERVARAQSAVPVRFRGKVAIYLAVSVLYGFLFGVAVNISGVDFRRVLFGGWLAGAVHCALVIGVWCC